MPHKNGSEGHRPGAGVAFSGVSPHTLHAGRPTGLLASVLGDLYPSGMLSQAAADLALRELRSAAAGRGPRAFVSLETPDDEVSAVRAALAVRIPVYFGAPQGRLYNEWALQRHLGYSTADALRMADGDPGRVRLAIAGPLHHVPGHRLVWCVHAYAPNLEGRNTRDYRALTDDAGALLRLPYKLRCAHLMRNVRACVHEALRRSAGYERARVFMPAIGLGAFLSQLSVDDAATAMTLCAHAVAEEWAMANYVGVYLHLCLHNAQARAAFAELPLEQLGITLHGPGGAGNLFNKLDEHAEDGLTLPIVINAWDDRAFVGNGGVNDQSVDGFFVGGYGPNEDFINGSYAHNVFLQPHLLEQSGWLTMESHRSPGRDYTPEVALVPLDEFKNAVAASLRLF